MSGKTPEGKVKAKVVGILKAAGAYYFFPVTGGFGRSGVPDIVACYRGKFIGIECKTGTKQPTALQNRELDRIVEAGGVSLVVREANISDVTEVLDFIDKENR
jgi:Holliday junction resolvase